MSASQAEDASSILVARSTRSDGPTAARQLSQSDNLISVSEVSATEAARSFASLLDAVEHRGERFTIVRRGKAIANLEPVREGQGAELKALLRRRRPDPDWRDDLARVRSTVEMQERP